MMNIRFALLVLLLLPGCARTVQRPQAGDRVTPEIILEEPWHGGGKAQVTIRLFVQGKDEAKPGFLQFENVPYEIEATADVVFRCDDEELERRQGLILARNC